MWALSLLFDFGMCFAPQRRAIFHLSSGQMATFRPSGATHHWNNTVNRDFSTFSRTCVFFRLTLSSDSFSSLIFSDLLSSSLLLSSPLLSSSLLFSSLTLTTSALPSVHIVGSLTSKLPSIISMNTYEWIECLMSMTFFLILILVVLVFLAPGTGSTFLRKWPSPCASSSSHRPWGGRG